MKSDRYVIEIIRKVIRMIKIDLCYKNNDN